MDPTATLIQILTELRDGNREDAVHALTDLAEFLGENRLGFMPDVDEAIDLYRGQQ